MTQKRFWMFVLSLAAIAVVSFIYFWPDAVEGNVLQQYDTTQGIANGQEVKAYKEATGVTSRWTGSLFSGMPTFQISPTYATNSWFGWINKVMGLGLPAPANLLAMMMVGFLILGLCMKMRWYVALIGAIGYGFSSYFMILIGAGHIWKYVTLAYIPPAIGGIVLAYRGKWLGGGALTAAAMMMQIAANHVQMTYYFLVIVLGMGIAYLVRAIKEGKVKEWVIATCLLVVAGCVGAFANLPSLYNTYEYSKETIRGGHSELTPLESATKGKPTGGLDRDYIMQYSYMPSETFTLLIPNVKGGATVKPEKGSMKAMTVTSLPAADDLDLDQAASQYLEWAQPSQYFGDPEGTNGPVYVGAIVCALFLLGCVIVKGPVKWALLALTVLSIALAWGRHMMWFTDLFIDYVPMYKNFRTVESILVIAGFAMPLLGALALDKLLRTKGEGVWRPLLWCFGIPAALCLLGIIIPSVYGDFVSDTDRQVDSMITKQLVEAGYDQSVINTLSLNNPRIYSVIESLRRGMVVGDSMRSLFILILGFILLALYVKQKLSLTVAALGCGFIICGDLFMVNKRYLDTESFSPKPLTEAPTIQQLPADRQILQDTAQSYRVMNLPYFYSPQPSYWHKSVGGYHAAKLTRYQDLIERHLAYVAAGQPTEADLNVLNMLNTRYIIDHNGEPMLNEQAYGNAWLVDTLVYVKNADTEMEALSRFNMRRTAVADEKFLPVLGTHAKPVQPGDTIRLTKYTPNQLTYTATTRGGATAVFSEIYFPWGWTTTIDGEPVETARVDYVLRAMDLPAGHHTIVWSFDPPSIHHTLWVAAVCIILVYIALLAWGIRSLWPVINTRVNKG